MAAGLKSIFFYTDRVNGSAGSCRGPRLTSKDWSRARSSLVDCCSAARCRVVAPLAEANDATGTMLREYVWMDDLPVAMVDDTGSSPVVYYIHTDQVGMPQKATDASANVVWDGVFDPFGNAVTTTGANWGTGLWGGFTWEPGSRVTLPLRFPGQYADVETALNQNWFRDYDPTIGRYVESDPIGLNGGINTYDYVGANSLVFSDPSGLLFGNPAVWERGLVKAGGSELIGGGPEDPLADIAALGFLGAALIEAITAAKQDSDCKCPPCRTVSGKVVPVGTVAYRQLDTPSGPQHGISGPHYNLYRANQAPSTSPQPCKCFWQPIGAAGQDALPANAIPIEPFKN